ncbi:MAG: LPP20 family lipoprotein [Desulfuromonadales bacterium]
MPKRFPIAVFLLLLFLAGCSAPKPPAWTLDPTFRYPAEAFLTGVGYSASRATAEDHARSEIAKIFQVDIHSQMSSSEAQAQSAVGDLVSSDYSQSVRAELVATSNKALSGVRIAEVWPDPRTGEYYALAVLDRLAAARPLRSQLNDLDLTIAEQVRLAENASNPARRLGHYLATLQALEQRQVVAGDLRVLAPSGWVMEPPRNAAAIAALADEAAGAIRLGVELEGDQGEIVTGSLVRKLTSVGMRMAPVGERNLTIRGTVRTEKYTTGDPWHWTVASAQVDLLEGSDLRVMDNLRTTIREGSRQSERSDIVAREVLGKKLASLLVERIVARR